MPVIYDVWNDQSYTVSGVYKYVLWRL